MEGPVALLLTTTRDDGDGELANRCLTLSVNEDPQQTAAIHQRQRAAYTRDGARATRRPSARGTSCPAPVGTAGRGDPLGRQLTSR